MHKVVIIKSSEYVTTLERVTINPEYGEITKQKQLALTIWYPLLAIYIGLFFLLWLIFYKSFAKKIDFIQVYKKILYIDF